MLHNASDVRRGDYNSTKKASYDQSRIKAIRSPPRNEVRGLLCQTFQNTVL